MFVSKDLQKEIQDVSKPDRYPGIRAFEKNQAKIFKGREKETQELYKLILGGNCTVLFSKSGLGKSSLLNAGISPYLTDNGFIPITIRLQAIKGDKANTPLSIVKTNLKVFSGKLKIESAPEEDLENLPLWEFLKSSSFPLGYVPVLLLDQFEEFFYDSYLHKTDFIYQLKEILHNEIPIRILDWYKKIPLELRTPEQIEWCSQPNIKIVVAIREDRFGDLKSISSVIPNIMTTLYKLDPLSSENAKEAIDDPAALVDENFASKCFKYEITARDMIIKRLTLGRIFLETTQLQIVCNQIEEIVKEKQKSTSTQVIVTSDMFEGEKGIDKMIKNFYNKQIDKIPQDIIKKADLESINQTFAELIVRNARELIETKMVQNTKRILLSEDQVRSNLITYFKKEAKNLGLPKKTHKESENYYMVWTDRLIESLLDLRLIRGDFREEQKIYEISHDTLLNPINDANKQRRIDAERIQRKKQIEDREKLLREAKQKADEERIQKEDFRRLKDIAVQERDNAKRMEALAEKEKKKATKERDNAYRLKILADDAKKKADDEKDNANKLWKKFVWLSIILFLLLIVSGILYYKNTQNSIRLENSISYQKASLQKSLKLQANDLSIHGGNDYLVFRLFQASEAIDSSDSYIKDFYKTHIFFELSGAQIQYDTINRLAIALEKDNSIQIWDIKSRPLRLLKRIDSTYNVHISHDSKKIAFTNIKGLIEVFDVPTMKNLVLPSQNIFYLKKELQKNETTDKIHLDFTFIEPGNILAIPDTLKTNLYLLDLENLKNNNVSNYMKKKFAGESGSKITDFRILHNDNENLWLFDMRQMKLSEIEKFTSKIINDIRIKECIVSKANNSIIYLDLKNKVSLIKKNFSIQIRNLKSVSHLFAVSDDDSVLFYTDKNLQLNTFDLIKQLDIARLKSIKQISNDIRQFETYSNQFRSYRDFPLNVRNYLSSHVQLSANFKIIFFKESDSIFIWDLVKNEIKGFYKINNPFVFFHVTDDFKYLSLVRPDSNFEYHAEIVNLRSYKSHVLPSTFTYSPKEETFVYINVQGGKEYLMSFSFSDGEEKIVRELEYHDNEPRESITINDSVVILNNSTLVFLNTYKDFKDYFNNIYPLLNETERKKYGVDNLELLKNKK